MSTPAPVEPPTPENVHLYRAAVLASRKAKIEELRRNNGNHKLVNTHAPKHAAALAVLELAPKMTYDEAWWLAHKATSWGAQAHHEWFWRGIPDNGYGL
jgi:hypothetical protein